MIVDSKIESARTHARTHAPAIPGEKHQSWDHQRDAYWFAAEKPAVMLNMGMGTGKSKVALDLVRTRFDRWVLILCPLSVVSVWPEQVIRHWPTDGWQPRVWALEGAVAQKAKTLREIREWEGAAIVVCNYESAWREPLASVIRAKHWDCVILDESHRVKAVPKYRRLTQGPNGTGVVRSGQAAAFVHELGQATHRIALSGTPMAHSPLDIWSQYMFLDPNIFGRSFFRFRDQFAVMGGFQGKQVLRYRDQEGLRERFERIAYSVSSNVLSLPPVLHETREFDLTPGTRRVYDALKEDLRAQVGDGTLTATNGMTQFLRLQQLTSGIARLDEGESATIISDEKMKALEDLLEDIDPGERVVVFAAFRPDLQRIAAVAARLDRSYGEISGDRHDGLDSAACYADEKRVVGVQLQSGGVGIDLSRARYAIYLSPGLSLANYEQSLARVHRPGQERPVTYYHLIARKTVDAGLYKALDRKRDLIQATIGELS